MPLSLKNRVVVVVGGTSGIGLEVARSALALDARVVAIGRSEAHAREAQAILGDHAIVRCLDIGDEHAIRSLFDGMTNVDHLIVTAGKVGRSNALEADMQTVRRLFDDRFWGTYNVIRHCAPLMPPTGSITLFSGNLAVRPAPGTSIVSAAVAAVEALGRALAVELKPIRVNTIRSGAVDTPLLRSRPDYEELKSRLTASLPVGRIGKPEDLAHAVLFLMGNPYTTGTVLQVDGGALIA